MFGSKIRGQQSGGQRSRGQRSEVNSHGPLACPQAQGWFRLRSGQGSGAALGSGLGLGSGVRIRVKGQGSKVRGNLLAHGIGVDLGSGQVRVGSSIGVRIRVRVKGQGSKVKGQGPPVCPWAQGWFRLRSGQGLGAALGSELGSGSWSNIRGQRSEIKGQMVNVRGQRSIGQRSGVSGHGPLACPQARGWFRLRSGQAREQHWGQG